MQRITIIYLLLSFSISSSGQGLSQQDEHFVDSTMNFYYKPNEPGAVLLIAKDGQPIYRKAYGLANLELNVPNKPEYLFAIGSMSKQFTSVCILRLAQEGKLKLGDEITKYLPYYNMHGNHITVENLLTHTSGIINHFSVEGAMSKTMLNETPQELMSLFSDKPLFFKPGTNWFYSNSNYILLGLIVEKVSGLSLSEYLEQNIFVPLKMSHTSVGNHDSVLFNAVTGYDFASPGKYKAPYLSWSWFYGAGQIVTCVDDLLKWDNALSTDRIVKKEWLDKAWEPFVLPGGIATSYGFAFASNYFNNIRFIDHGGSTVGFNCEAIRIPLKKLFIVILSNTTTKWSPAVVTPITLRITGQTLPPLSSFPFNEKGLADFTGVYALQHETYTAFDSANGQIYRYFTAKGDTLFETSAAGALNPLFYISKDLFTTTWSSPFYQFHRDNKDHVVSVEIFGLPFQYGPHECKIKTNMPLPKKKKSIILGNDELKMIKGKYDFGGGNIIPVTVEGNKVYMRQPGQDKEEIFAENKTHFFSKNDFTVEFIKDNGVVIRMIVNVGVKYEGKKIE